MDKANAALAPNRRGCPRCFMAPPYVPLRLFSCYTMLEGAMEPKAIAKQAKRLDFPAAAVTDRNGLYGAMPFSDACSGKGVQPIIGAMLAVARPPERHVVSQNLEFLSVFLDRSERIVQSLPDRRHRLSNKRAPAAGIADKGGLNIG